MQEIKTELVGTTPILFHNSRLVNPFDPVNAEKKRLTEKRTKKTEDDIRQIAKLEWTAGWYWDDTLGPVLPTANLLASLTKAAKATRNGPLVAKGVNATSLEEPINYKGPRTLEELWGDGLDGSPYVDYRPVGQQAVKIMRCRPMLLPGWSVITTFLVDETIIDPEHFITMLSYAGRYVGVGDFRALYGRFSVNT